MISDCDVFVSSVKFIGVSPSVVPGKLELRVRPGKRGDVSGYRVSMPRIEPCGEVV